MKLKNKAIVLTSLMLVAVPVMAFADGTGIKLVGFTNIYDFLNFIVKTMLSIAAIIAVIFLIIGGVRYVVSASNADAVEGAKNTILYAVIGLIVIMLSWFIVTAVANIFGSTTTSDNQNQAPGALNDTGAGGQK